MRALHPSVRVEDFQLHPSPIIEESKGVSLLVNPSGIRPSSQVVLERLTVDEVTGDDILDWVLPDERINGWGLPGHGVAKDDCGSYGMKACLNVDDHPDGLAVFKAYSKHCFSPECPTCWSVWAKREAGRIDKRITQAVKMHPHLGKPIHFMMSVPESEWSLAVSKLRERAISIAIKVGFLGGSLIWHPDRETDDPRWYFSPHFHMIGFGYIKGLAVAYEFESNCWISRNLGVRKSVFGTAFYQLTHCGVWYGDGARHSVTWFGALAYNKLSMPSKFEQDDDKRRCPYCGAKMRSVIWIGDHDPLPCSGIDGFFLAPCELKDGSNKGFWIDSYINRLTLLIPNDLGQCRY